MSKFLTALYCDRDAVELAVERLLELGCSREDISVLMSDGTRGRDFSMEQNTKAPEGAAAGAAIGGALGAISAGLVAVGSVAVPGVGLLAVGPIVAALAGAGAGGAAGGLFGALVGSGVPEHEAILNTERLQKGDILIGIEVHEDRRADVEKIFETTGASHLRSG